MRRLGLFADRIVRVVGRVAALPWGFVRRKERRIVADDDARWLLRLTFALRKNSSAGHDLLGSGPRNVTAATILAGDRGSSAVIGCCDRVL